MELVQVDSFGDAGHAAFFTILPYAIMSFTGDDGWFVAISSYHQMILVEIGGTERIVRAVGAIDHGCFAVRLLD